MGFFPLGGVAAAGKSAILKDCIEERQKNWEKNESTFLRKRNPLKQMNENENQNKKGRVLT